MHGSLSGNFQQKSHESQLEKIEVIMRDWESLNFMFKVEEIIKAHPVVHL